MTFQKSLIQKVKPNPNKEEKKTTKPKKFNYLQKKKKDEGMHFIFPSAVDKPHTYP